MEFYLHSATIRIFAGTLGELLSLCGALGALKTHKRRRPLNLGQPSVPALRQALEIQGGACVYAFMEYYLPQSVPRFKGAHAFMRLWSTTFRRALQARFNGGGCVVAALLALEIVGGV